PPQAITPAEAKVKKLQGKIADLNRELRQAEEEVERQQEAARKEAALPPRDKPVAVIFGDEKVTREELAEYLLARMTAQQLDQYLNLRILEHAARAKGVRVSSAEVDTYLLEELKRAGLTEKTFRDRVLADRKMTLPQWKQEVARPQLLLKKLVAA